MKNVYLSMLLILLIASCSKDKIVSNGEEKQVARIANVDEFAVFGVVHNMGLDFMANKNSNLHLLSQTERYSLSRTFTYDNWMQSSLFTANEMIDTINYINELYVNSNNVAHELVVNGILAPEVESYFNRINIVFEDVLSLSQQGIILSPSEVNLRIEVIESDILLNNIQYDTSTTEGDWFACMMATTSVAKASYLYWYNAATNTNSSWNFIVSGYGEKLPIPKWLKKVVDVVKTDVSVGVIAYDIHRDAGQSGVGSLGRSIGDGFSGSATVAKPSSK